MSDVIQPTLELIQRKLNQALSDGSPSAEDAVILSNIADQDLQAYQRNTNKVVMWIGNIQRARTMRNLPPAVADASDPRSPFHLDLFVVFMANFQDRNYPAGLGMISRIISFFDQQSLFTRESLPGLEAGIDQLTFEMENLGLEDLNYLLTMAGVTYLPLVYYRVRLTPVTGADA